MTENKTQDRILRKTTIQAWWERKDTANENKGWLLNWEIQDQTPTEAES